MLRTFLQLTDLLACVHTHRHDMIFCPMTSHFTKVNGKLNIKIVLFYQNNTSSTQLFKATGTCHLKALYFL